VALQCCLQAHTCTAGRESEMSAQQQCQDCVPHEVQQTELIEVRYALCFNAAHANSLRAKCESLSHNHLL